MKKIAILFVIVIIASSCSLFEKPSIDQAGIDALVNQKAMVEEELINLKQEYELLKIKADECAQMLEKQVAEENVSGKYFVIAGSFKNSSYAQDFSTKVKQMGGSGSIINGPYSFNLVAYSSHNTLKEAAQSMYVARTNISQDAWVYMQK